MKFGHDPDRRAATERFKEREYNDLIDSMPCDLFSILKAQCLTIVWKTD